MARYILYPAVGQTVLDEDGNVIPPQGGGPYLINDYYDRKMLTGMLLRADPLASGENPVLPPGPGATITGPLTDELSARSGKADLEVVSTSGKTVTADGGADDFVFRLGVSSGADGYNKINGPNGQYQRRSTARAQTLTAVGLPTDGSPCQVTLQARMNSACTDGGELDLTPSGISVGLTQYVLTDTVEVTGGPKGAKFVGHGGQTQGFESCQFLWMGASNKPMFHIRTGGNLFKGFNCTTVPGYPLQQFFNFTNGTQNCTNNVFEDISFTCASVTTAAYQYCFTTDFAGAASGNCEDFRLVRIRAFDFAHSFILHSGFSQPYNWSVSHSYIANFNRLPLLHGRAFSGSIASSSCSFYDSFFYGLEALNGSVATVSFINCTSERCKFYDDIGFTTAAYPFVMIGGRHSPDAVDVQSTGPVGYAASVVGGISRLSRGPITLQSVNFQQGLTERPFRIGVGGNGSLKSSGCVYPNSAPFFKTGVLDAEIPGGLFSEGDKGMSNATGQAEPLLPLHGCNNPDGQVTISGTSSRATVDFALTESNGSYIVTPGIAAYTGTPAAGSTHARGVSKNNAGFVMELEAAPGGGNSVTVSYMLRLARPASASTAVGETDFSSDTVRRTASPGGVAGSPAATFLCAVFRLDSIAVTSDQFLVDCGFVASARGFAFEIGGGVAFNGRWSNAGNDLRTPTRTLTSTDVGKTHVAHFVHDGTVGRLYFNGSLVGTSTAGALVASTGPTQIGGSDNYATSFLLTQATLFGVSGGNAAPNASQVAAHCQAIKAAGEIVDCAGVTDTRLWVTDGRATVTDDVGSDDITLVSGTTPVFVTVQPAWAF